ncbi:hypothetical protein [Gemmobacter denitrificans]|uniref:Alpha/beta hydrolase n=1 Tax=Gemmobacter denitrificans TaxID=3123040 RepID=A0ABU8BTJ9_9RHOB
MAELGLPAPFAADLVLPDAPTGLLVIAFSSIGHDPSRMPAPEFRRMAIGTDRAALFFRDQSRSWASHPGWAGALRQAVAAVPQPIRRIVTLGVSMGAVSALRAAEVLPVDAVLAFGPQHDLRNEARWSDWTADQTIPPCPLPAGPWITLCHGMQDDAAQAMAFPMQEQVDHLLFPKLGHSTLAPHLKTHGLQGMVDALCRGDRRRLLAIAQAAGGQRRQLPR